MKKKLSFADIIKKTIGFKGFETLEKGVKELQAMYGPNIQPHQQEFVNWAQAKLPNSNWQEWAVKNHAKDSKAFTPKVMRQLEHFGGSKHIPDIDKVRFDNHDLKQGLESFKQAEDAFNTKNISSPQIIKPGKKTTKLMDLDKDYAWFALNKPYCETEGKAMGHCGNKPSAKKGQNVLSLRRKLNFAKKEYHEPVATFILEPDGETIGEMKGKANLVPSPKYHKYIKALFENTNFLPEGGGYLPGNNFHLDDLSHEDHDDLIAKRPELAEYSNRLVTPKKYNEEYDELIKDPKYHWHLAENLQHLDPKYHGELVNNKYFQVQAALAWGLRHIDPKYHGILVNNKDESVQKGLAYNLEHLDPKYHGELVNNKSEDVQRALAQNLQNLDSKYHGELVNNKDFQVQAALAENLQHLDPKYHGELVNSKSQYAQQYLAENLQHLDPKYHGELVNNKDFQVQAALAKNLQHLDPKYHGELVNNKSEDVQRALAQNLQNLDSKYHGELVNNKSEDVQRALAQNLQNLDPKYHETFLNHKRTDFRQRALKALLGSYKSKKEKEDLLAKINLTDEEKEKIINELKLERLKKESDTTIAKRAERVKEYKNMKMAKSDILPGGAADNIPKKDFDQDRLAEGTAHEQEHTENKQIASEIARDHLLEDPNYYKKLKAIESKKYFKKKLEKAALNKTEGLEKGLKGDWKKEGYKISHTDLPIEHQQRGVKGIRVTANDKLGNQVGFSDIEIGRKNATPLNTEVKEEHRRKGIATGMYQYAERNTGTKMNPSKDRTDAGKALWRHGQKQWGHTNFGKSETYFKKLLNKTEIIFIINDPESYTLEKAIPKFLGEKHPENPWIAAKHPNGITMWHSDKQKAAKDDEILNNTNRIDHFTSTLPKRHQALFRGIVNSIKKDPNRHFIPTEENGVQKLRARHIKSLLSGKDDVTLDSSNPDVLTVTRYSHSQGKNQGLPPIKISFKGVSSGNVEKNERGTTTGTSFTLFRRLYKHILQTGNLLSKKETKEQTTITKNSDIPRVGLDNDRIHNADGRDSNTTSGSTETCIGENVMKNEILKPNSAFREMMNKRKQVKEAQRQSDLKAFYDAKGQEVPEHLKVPQEQTALNYQDIKAEHRRNKGRFAAADVKEQKARLDAIFAPKTKKLSFNDIKKLAAKKNP